MEKHEVQITIENTGTIVLTNLKLGYSVRHGTTTDLTGWNTTKKKLTIGEQHTYSFYWTPALGDGEQYTISANITGNNFGLTVGPFITQETIEIRDVKKDVGPIDFGLNTEPAALGAEYSNRSQIIHVKVKNFGNYDLTNQFQVEASVYSLPTWQEVWHDTEQFTNPIPANKYRKITFNKPWQPLFSNLYFLNISTGLNNDEKPINDNITVPLGIRDIVDAGILQINNLENGGNYPCEPFGVSTLIGNQGNQNITNDFYVELMINDYPSGNTLFNPSAVQILYAVPGNVSKPGDIKTVVFPPWTYMEGLKPAKVWINISINPFENNGTTSNNDLSILIELKNKTKVDLECLYPNEALLYPDDVTNVSVLVKNTGTEDLDPYILNLTVENMFKEGEFWHNYKVTAAQPILPWNNEVIIELLADWDLKFNTKFELNITLALAASPSVPMASCTRVFEIDGGEVNGTFAGTVFDADDQSGLEDIKVRVYTTGFYKKLINSTVTDSNGKYSVSAPGKQWGTEYSVEVNDADNYWWSDASKTKKLYSGRETELNLTTIRKPTGTLKGMVTLASPTGAPEAKQDWSGTTITVENTPISISPDASGNFEVELVAEVVNISSAKPNFHNARIEYVTILEDQTETVELILVEAWAVSVTPSHHAYEVNSRTYIIAEFDSPLDKTTIKPSSFSLKDASGTLVPGITKDNFTFAKDDKVCRLKPPGRLRYNTTYKIELTAQILTNTSSTALHRKWSSTFQTAQGLGTVVGRCAYYWSQMPLKGINVTLNDLSGFKSETDSDGYFIIENIPTGEHEINVSMEGYDPIIRKIMIYPEIITWENFTFDDGLPVPSLWGENQFGRTILIDDNTTDPIKIDSKFNLTSILPLDPESVNSETIKIIEKSSGDAVSYKSITSSNNNLKFKLTLAKNLKFDTVYQVIYTRELRTIDYREIFWKDYLYTEFRTETRYPLVGPSVYPPNNAVNIPIDITIIVEFLIGMNRSSVESAINSSFQITNFAWSNFNMTLILHHDAFDHFTPYTISLFPGMRSESGVYQLLDYVNISFVTISGIVQYLLGPVLDTSGNPLKGVSLVIFDSAGTDLRSSVTDDNGYANFYFESRLEPGNYSVKFIKSGYKTVSWEISIGQDGELRLDTDPPTLAKEKDKTGSGLGSLEVLIVALVIIMIILLYLIIFKLKPGGKDEDAQSRSFKERMYGLFKREKPSGTPPVKTAHEQRGKDRSQVSKLSKVPDAAGRVEKGQEGSVQTRDKTKREPTKTMEPTRPFTGSLVDKLKDDRKK
jgi:hypothetical protein